MGELKGGPLTSQTVHLCVDMQRIFSTEGPWPTPWMERVLPTVTRIAERFPERTVFTRFITPETPEQATGVWRHYYERWRQTTREHLDPRLLELMPPLARLAPPAPVFDKPVYSAFAGHRLHDHLQERSADALVVTGSETDVCVLATVLGAVDHGYRVIVVTDAVCSSSDEGHDSLLKLYRERYSLQIETADSETILSLWPG
ncbi:MAG TPA: isochorismatase family cysteine hydrolase [Beijerinckiaceae bacterium]|nr:isochorismatase family cysteine hydrolase [Beijerinckiaceae bacterium]